MKMTVKELLSLKQGLVGLLNIPVSSAAVGYRIQNNVRKIEEELQTYMKVSQELLKEHVALKDGEPISLGEGNGYLLKKEGAEEFHKKNKELEEEVCEITLQKFIFEELDMFEESLTAGALFLLEPLIQVQEEPIK